MALPGPMELIIIGAILLVPLLIVIVVVALVLNNTQKKTGGPRLLPCPQCGQHVPAEAKFCPECGGPLARP